MNGNAVGTSCEIDVLANFLKSGRAAPDALTLSGLDGFITGICAGPSRVRPVDWVPEIWGSQAPQFADEQEAQAVIDCIRRRHSAILGNIVSGEIDPIYVIDKDGKRSAADWADGFARAILLSAKSWDRLFRSQQMRLALFPILALCRAGERRSILEAAGERSDQLIERAIERIPQCVLGIDGYWRLRDSGLQACSVNQLLPAKTGRNEPCPCGSGNKFKRCCGQGRVEDIAPGQAAFAARH